MRKQFATLLVVAAFASCKSREYHLKDLIDTEAIDSVTIHNNSGDYRLNPVELRAFRNTLGEMQYLPEADLKMGAIGFDTYLHGQGYYIATGTHSRYVKMHRSLVDQNSHLILPILNPIKSEELIFKFDETVNLDNFRKQPSPDRSASREYN